MEASSNNDNVDNMKEEGLDDLWISDITDENPSVNITVADEDSFVKSVTVQNTTNVDYITVTVYNEEGEMVYNCVF